MKGKSNESEAPKAPRQDPTPELTRQTIIKPEPVPQGQTTMKKEPPPVEQKLKAEE